ncbi:MAG: sulfotransferase family 2 domain-containing protein [Paracoccaceae bacterium]
MEKPVYLNPLEHDDLVTRLLAPFFPRYRVLRALDAYPASLRGPLRNLVMTLDRKFLFLRNLKCGCTSISQLMYYYSMGAFYPRHIHRARKGVHLARYDWREIEPVYKNHDAVVFTFSRDPEARAYSAFTNFFVDQNNLATHNHMEGMRAHGFSEDRPESENFDVFLDYVEHGLEIDPLRTSAHFRPQVINIAYGQVDYDFIGKLERIETDLPHVFEMGGRPGFPPPDVLSQRFNSSQAERAPLSEAQRRRVRDIFAADYEAFGYD